ncbi:PadR family transcriptional regulator [Oscillatoria sp. CS-180]|uniref:PadR family transcriptional regulator n=1 Tax=Oscillatoria sp. CS-180 TaxID=3021720 RepID=UPI00232B9D87|nr:PadR family transcriptional regulator [Oscillatoria sp. CS-180]MDB9526977.1 PadR family transcriptional regulator [Oscillatoria sp. CS-180]
MPQKQKSKPVVLSELEKTLLTLLNGQRLYGTEFVDAIREASDGEREIGVGSLYPTLTRMEKKGFVRWEWGDETSGPRRKYYFITPYGKDVLEKDWRFHQRLRDYVSKEEMTSSPQAKAQVDKVQKLSKAR